MSQFARALIQEDNVAVLIFRHKSLGLKDIVWTNRYEYAQSIYTYVGADRCSAGCLKTRLHTELDTEQKCRLAGQGSSCYSLRTWLRCRSFQSEKRWDTHPVVRDYGIGDDGTTKNASARRV